MKSNSGLIELRPGYIIGQFVDNELTEVMLVKQTLRTAVFGKPSQAEAYLVSEPIIGIPPSNPIFDVPRKLYRGKRDIGGVITMPAREVIKADNTRFVIELRRMNPQHKRVRDINWP